MLLSSHLVLFLGRSSEFFRIFVLRLRILTDWLGLKLSTTW